MRFFFNGYVVLSCLILSCHVCGGNGVEALLVDGYEAQIVKFHVKLLSCLVIYGLLVWFQCFVLYAPSIRTQFKYFFSIFFFLRVRSQVIQVGSQVNQFLFRVKKNNFGLGIFRVRLGQKILTHFAMFKKQKEEGGFYQNPKGPLPPSPPSLCQWTIVCMDRVCWIQEIF